MSLVWSVCVYGGALLAIAGLVMLVRPIGRHGIATRRGAGMLLAAACALVVTGFAMPSPESRVDSARTELDRYFSSWQFGERHVLDVSAPPDRVYRAVKEVTADDIRLFRTLTWIRRLGRRGPTSILNAPERTPILDVAARSGFRILTDSLHEIVVVTLVAVPRAYAGPPTLEEFRTLSRPGYAKAGINFVIEPISPVASRVITETRVFATDAVTAARFKRYWRVIYPGSALIRVMWLRAVKRRAEGM
jgi:hypothetical protein